MNIIPQKQGLVNRSVMKNWANAPVAVREMVLKAMDRQGMDATWFVKRLRKLIDESKTRRLDYETGEVHMDTDWNAVEKGLRLAGKWIGLDKSADITQYQLNQDNSFNVVLGESSISGQHRSPTQPTVTPVSSGESTTQPTSTPVSKKQP